MKLRVSKLVQYVAFLSLLALPWAILSARDWLLPYSVVAAGLFLILGILAAVWHRNFTEDT